MLPMSGGSETQIIGHRGAAGHAPENTEAAILAGLRLGANALEVDLQFTADGAPVVFHDRTLERMAGVKGRIRDHTARELAGYDIGFRFGGEYRGQRILSLDEAAALAPRDVTLHVEIKDYDAVSSAHLKEMLAALRRRGGVERCLFTSFGEKVLAALRAAEGRARRGLLVSGPARGAAKKAAELGCYSLHPEVGHTAKALIEECHTLGLKVFPYTANDPAQMKQILAFGADGLYTDYPGRLAEVLGRAPRGAAEHRERSRRDLERAGRTAGAAREPTRYGGGRTQARAGIRREEAQSAPLATSRDLAAEAEEPVAAEEITGRGQPVIASGAEAPSSADGVRKKRRRGRRGGRRHPHAAGQPLREGGETPGSETPDRHHPGTAAAHEAAWREPAAETGGGGPQIPAREGPEPEDSAGAVTASGPAEAQPAPSGATPAASGPSSKKRRGRRGGRRHRGRRPGSDPVAGGSPPGGET